EEFMKGVAKHSLRTIWAIIGGLAILFANQGTLFGKAQSKEAPERAAVKLDMEALPLNRELKAPISFAPVIKKVAPSVVNIYSTTTVREHPSDNPLLNDPFFRHFFGDQSGNQGQPREHKAQSLGSGVIVSPDGYILTANHVIDGAQTIKVSLANGEAEYEAEVIGTDPPSDVAVLKINVGKRLPALPVADSDKLEVGDMVLAIGNPFGVGQTVTMGIISALGRGGLGISGYEDFIQTDAAINPGNSGGALVDAEGRLVGINTAILSRSGGFQGVGFAVPVNMARFAMDRITRFGKVTRGFLGIYIQPLTPDLAKEFNLPANTSGALVGGVTPNSPAARAGLQDGDVVTSFNGKRVTDSRNLQLMVAETSPDTKVTVGILRGEPGQRASQKSFATTLGELPTEKTVSQANPNGNRGENNQDVMQGVEVTDLDASARQQFDVPTNVHGALVVNVEPGSSAADAGLQAGDVIVGINRQPVHNAQDAARLGQQSNGPRMLLRVWSKGAGGQGGTHYVVIENAKKTSD
ncbi:MAG: DegQ family serine endoprotease, partial [Candidatus Dormibacteraceae bacterium]